MFEAAEMSVVNNSVVEDGMVSVDGYAAVVVSDLLMERNRANRSCAGLAVSASREVTVRCDHPGAGMCSFTNNRMGHGEGTAL